MPLTWDRKPTDLVRDIERYGDTLRNGVYAIGDGLETSLPQDAQAHHPWVNRTGDAEAGLNAFVVKTRDLMQVFLAHGVDYGVFLEKRRKKDGGDQRVSQVISGFQAEFTRGGKWAVIWPTIMRALPDTERKLQALVGK